MKTLWILIIVCVFYGCAEPRYSLTYLEKDKNEYGKVLDLLSLGADDKKSLKIYSFELKKCEVNINGVMSSVLDTEGNCDGKIQGSHRLDLLIEGDIQAGSKTFLISAERDTVGLVLGPTLVYEGLIKPEPTNPSKKFFHFHTGFKLVQKGNKAMKIKPKMEVRRKADIDLEFNHLISKTSKVDTLVVNQIILRGANHISGAKPQVFDLVDLINREAVFVCKPN